MRRTASRLLVLTLGLSALTVGYAPAGTAVPAVAPAPAPAAATATTDHTPAVPGADRAVRRLRADATGTVRLHRNGAGAVDFVSTGAHDSVQNPDQTAAATPLRSAREDLNRYGAALGVADPASTLSPAGTTSSVTGGSVVRFDQLVSGHPVLGGQVVVGLDADGDLSSVLATTSPAGSVPAPRVARSSAAGAARRVTAGAHKLSVRKLTVTGGGVWVFDPAAFGMPGDDGARPVRRFEVSNGTDVRELVLVDAVSGRVLLHVNGVEDVSRAVCDRDDVRGDETTCTSGAARSEGQPASAVTDVNDAYDLSGEVSTFYQQIAGLDLTELIGVGTAGSRTLASTVRFCTTATSDDCPYANAFWNGTQMYYGSGYAGADDVVGHEMTHGVISHYSDLFYLYQSGAINESIADTMGEIIDHRNASPGDSPTNWDLGEDLPGGALRNLANPLLHGQPDKMTSSKYDSDPDLVDSGGVHTNSGVGNKTAYLISQGGAFDGQTVTGIDKGDPGLTKTATLYFDVIKNLTSGSDYADLGRVLNQSCADLAGAGTAGFTAADCANVAKAVLATQLATQPTVAGASTPADAPVGCPAGQSKDVLFDDATAPAADEATLGSQWVRAPDAADGIPSNATSGNDSWFGLDPDTASQSSMTLKQPISVPAGGQTYLRFNHWYLFDYDLTPTYYDGGDVLVDDVGDSAAPQPTASLPWVNGPTKTVLGSGTPATGFGGSSNGYTSSRLDLSSYAGKTIQPQFRIRSDDAYAGYGWYLDDVEVYTCGVELPSTPPQVVASGGLSSAKVRWSTPSYAGDGITGYQVTGSGGLRSTTAPGTHSVTFGRLRPGRTYSFTVAALNREAKPGGSRAVTLAGTRLRLAVAKSGRKATRVSGRFLASTAIPLRRTIVIQRLTTHHRWRTLKLAKTRRTGRFAVTVRGRSRARYRLYYRGYAGVIGSTSVSKRL